MERYDVVIAGAGIAGASAASFLARKGIKVLLVDIKPFSRAGDKACGDAIGKHHLDELGIEPPKGEELEGIVKSIDVYSPYEDVKYRVLGDGFEINRIAFTQRFIKEAINYGATYLDNTQALEPIIKSGKVSGIKLWRRDRGTWEVHAEVVIDATGAARCLARKLPKDWPVSEELDLRDAVIAYREVRLLRDEVDEAEVLRIFLSKKIAPGGYWWFFPYSLNPKKVNVGLGIQGGMGYPHPKDLLYKYVFTRPEFKGSEVIEAGGAIAPTRRPLPSLVWHGVAVIGDAAYTVNPIHGGGKGSAMLSAYCVAEAINDALSEGDVSAKGLWSANICFMGRYGSKQVILDIFRQFLQRLSNDDLEYGMKKKLINEEDLNILSLKGDLELSVVEKAMRLLAGIGRPSLLLKLKNVARYMNKARQHCKNYPEDPSGINKWLSELLSIYREFKEKVLK